MEFKKYKNRMDNLVYENMTYRIVIPVLAVALIIQGFMIVNKINNQKIVFVPPAVMAKEFWIAGESVSKTYLESIAQFISSNILNVTEKNANYGIENVLKLVPSDVYGDVKESLEKQSTYILDNGISRVFYPSSIDVDTPNVIKINGVQKDIIGDKVARSKVITVQIDYRIEATRFYLINFKKLEKK